MDFDGLDDYSGENMTNLCGNELGAPLMCLVDNVPVVYGINDMFYASEG